MAKTQIPKRMQYITDGDGKRTAVVLDIQTWESLVEWMEDTADTHLAIKALTELQAAGGPRQASWLPWESVREDWGDDDQETS